jgi:hypothetical protein
MLNKRRALPLGLMLAASLLLARPAPAAVVDPIQHCTQDPTTCDVTVTVPGATGQPGTSTTDTCRTTTGTPVQCFVAGKGWWGGDGCWYQPATGNDLAAAVAVGGTPKPPGQWYLGSCGNPAVNFWPVVKFRVLAAGPAVQLLAQQAVQALRMPAPLIRLNPAPPTGQLVNVPMWMWVDASTWGTRSATATAGGVSVTAAAMSTSVAWSTGDGATLVCPGPGQAWTPGEDPAARSFCSHSYTVPGAYTVRATVTWDVSWTGGGQSGTVPALSTTASIPAAVRQAAALNTNEV